MKLLIGIIISIVTFLGSYLGFSMQEQAERPSSSRQVIALEMVDRMEPIQYNIYYVCPSSGHIPLLEGVVSKSGVFRTRLKVPLNCGFVAVQRTRKGKSQKHLYAINNGALTIDFR